MVKALDILQTPKSAITLSEFALFTGQKLTDENRVLIRGNRDAITPQLFRQIVAKNYWAQISGPKLPFEHGVFALDAALAHGSHKTRLMLQKAVGAKADGIIGPKTLAALKAMKPAAFIDALTVEREALLKSTDDWDLKATDWRKSMADLKARLLPPPPTLPARPTIRYVTEGQSTPTITEKKMSDTPAPVAPEPAYKPWSQSLTIWGTIVTFASTVLPALAQMMGWDISAGDVQSVGTGVTTAIQAIGGVIGTVMAIIGRTKATAPVKFL
jgi:lysozyme family protein